jgi:recombination associated protein RdgC
MGLLSSSVSLTRYRVEGQFADPVMDTVTGALTKNMFTEIEDPAASKSMGWTSFTDPYRPDFSGSSYLIDTQFVFSLRIDKKAIPSKVFKKHYTMEVARRLAESGREFLSREEKTAVREHVMTVLQSRMPATPNLYDVVWNYERQQLWFFTNLKSANEDLETLFVRSFRLSLIRLFPYTAAFYNPDLPDTGRDVLAKLTPTRFVE